MRIIRRGDAGDAVRDIQHRFLGLGYRIDPDELEGRFGPSTERAVRGFQQARGLPADGLVGPDTWGQLVEAGYRLGDRVLYLRSPAFRGDDVRELQRRLNALGFDAGREDGIFGEATQHAVVEFQRNTGEPPDAIVGPATVDALLRVRSGVPGPSRAVVREAEAMRGMTRPLAGCRVAVDPGHGPVETGPAGPGGMVEGIATVQLAQDLSEELALRGALPTLLRRPDEDPAPSERARSANELGADVCVSIHLGCGEPEARGAVCSYFGTDQTYSPAGQRLAEIVCEELSERAGVRPVAVRRLAVAMLRETRMPAVQVEPCFVTNPDDEALLGDPAWRRAVAHAVADALQRFVEGRTGRDRAGTGSAQEPAVSR
ncbi:MAG: N-acetylmuramoyl-L-alanine amidase [Candidatus Velamenicoccus archaeovorus]